MSWLSRQVLGRGGAGMLALAGHGLSGETAIQQAPRCNGKPRRWIAVRIHCAGHRHRDAVGAGLPCRLAARCPAQF